MVMTLITTIMGPNIRVITIDSIDSGNIVNDDDYDVDDNDNNNNNNNNNNPIRT